MCNMSKYLLFFQVQELIAVRELIYVFNLFSIYIHDSNRNIYILKSKRFIFFLAL